MDDEPLSDDIAVEFVLYAAGDLPNSHRAASNLRAFCREELTALYRIQVIDVFDNPEKVLADRVLLTPQLIMRSPGGRRVVVGDLTDRDRLRRAVNSLGTVG